MFPSRLLLAMMSVALPAQMTWAQDAARADAEATADATEGADTPESGEVTIGEQGSEQDPLAGREPTGGIEPERNLEVKQVEGVLGLPALSVKIDPRVLGVAPGDPLPALRREGEAVRKRDGRLLPSGDSGRAVFILDADPEAGDDQPLAMVVAPCLTLESMERLLEDRGEDLRFTVTGMVHTYRGVNYLLPTAQPRPWLISNKKPGEKGELIKEPVGEPKADAPESDAPDKTETESTSSDTPDKSSDVPADQSPDQSPDKKGDEATPSADEVLNELLNERRDAPTPIAPPPTDLSGDTANGKTKRSRTVTDPLLLGLDPDQPQAELKDEGEFIIARTGRLIHSADGANWLFVLDADKAAAPEPPMIVHACKLLETMEKTVREQGEDVPFVVTGQVFVYRGANYLLPTIVKREFERGNLE